MIVFHFSGEIFFEPAINIGIYVMELSVFQKFRQQTDIFIRLFIEKLDVTAVWYNLFTDMGDMSFQQLDVNFQKFYN